MAKIETGKQLAEAVVDVAKNYKTLYVMGCFGAPMTDSNKTRYCSNHTYNQQASRTKMIQAASADTFGFDCVNLIKGLMWGWNGDKNKTYGGAAYNTNNVPDVNANSMINLCTDVTTDFSNILVGEAVWMSGHIGVYIGDGLAVECTPKWENNVQITAVTNIGTKSGYNGRKWTKHGKLPFLTYEAPPAPVLKSIDEVAQEVLDGKWGNGTARKNALVKAGYDYAKVQAKVNELVNAKNTPVLKSIDEVAQEVLDGKWGNGTARKTALTNAGYDYAKVQAKVNELVKAKNTPALKSIDEVAKEVLNGKWGNGTARKKALTEAGYDYAKVQAKVNELVKAKK